MTEWCVFCAEIISHLNEVFWWRRDIGKSRFFLLFVIYTCIKIFSLKLSPVTSLHFKLSNRLSTHADSVTIDQKSSLPACISCPTLRKSVGKNVLNNPLLRVRFYVFWYYSCKILKSVERELRDLLVWGSRDRGAVEKLRMTTELWKECDYKCLLETDLCFLEWIICSFCVHTKPQFPYLTHKRRWQRSLRLLSQPHLLSCAQLKLGILAVSF